MLTVIDSSGQVGGIPNTHYTVECEYIAYLANRTLVDLRFAATGPSTSCLPSATDDLAVITPNVTDLLTTCEPWGLTMLFELYKNLIPPNYVPYRHFW